MDQTFLLPGTTAPEITVRRTLLGNVSLLVEGRAVPRKGRWRPAYLVPLPDGTTKSVTLTGSFGGLKANVDGVQVPIERPLRPWELALVLLPFGLVAVGGAIGAGLGAVAAGANASVMRSTMGSAARIITALLNLTLAGVAWFAISYALRLLLS